MLLRKNFRTKFNRESENSKKAGVKASVFFLDRVSRFFAHSLKRRAPGILAEAEFFVASGNVEVNNQNVIFLTYFTYRNSKFYFYKNGY